MVTGGQLGSDVRDIGGPRFPQTPNEVLGRRGEVIHLAVPKFSFGKDLRASSLVTSGSVAHRASGSFPRSLILSV